MLQRLRCKASPDHGFQIPKLEQQAQEAFVSLAIGLAFGMIFGFLFGRYSSRNDEDREKARAQRHKETVSGLRAKRRLDVPDGERERESERKKGTERERKEGGSHYDVNIVIACRASECGAPCKGKRRRNDSCASDRGSAGAGGFH